MSFEKLQRRYVPEQLDCSDWSQIEPLFQGLLERELDSPEATQQWLQDASETSAVVREYAARRNIDYACHNDDEAIEKAYMHYVENIAPKLQPVYFELQKKLIESPFHESLDSQTYGVMLRQWRQGVELFREDNIPLGVEVTKLNAEYDKLIGAMTVEYDGKVQTLQQLARYQESTDREVREKTWTLSVNRRLEDREKIDGIYDQMLKLRSQIAANADCDGFRTYLFKDMCRFDYTPEDCLEFGNSVESLVVPLLAKQHEARREAMGLDTLKPWDLAVDVAGRDPLQPFYKDNVEDLVNKCNTVFGLISPELQDVFSKLQFGRNLDLESRQGKRAGGFQSSLPESGEPFIFMNAAGLQRDVETLLHEGGHAFHYVWSHDAQPLTFLHGAPLEFCEVASMGMELLAMDHFEVFYGDKEPADRARKRMLEDIVKVLCWIATIDGFQHWIYTHPGHSVEERTQAWLEYENRFGGGVIDHTGFEDAHAAMWQRQLHLFHVPFYYIEYGIAQLGALQLWLNYREDPEQTLQQYRQALSLGDTQPLPKLYEAAGLRFDFSADTIGPLIDAVEAELANM